MYSFQIRYLENVYPDLKIPEEDADERGTLQQGGMCLDTLGHLTGGAVGLYPCHGTGGNQAWHLTKSGNIKHSDLCVSLERGIGGSEVKLRLCNNSERQV